jgi:colicin import membrane protein
MAKAKTTKSEMSPGLAAFAAASATEGATTTTAATEQSATDSASPESVALAAVAAGEGNAPVGDVVVNTTTQPDGTVVEGKHEFNPVIKSDAQLLKEDQERRAAEATAAKEKKAADKAAADQAKADAKAKKEADKKAAAEAKTKESAEKKAAREAASAERKERLAAAAEGKNYTGSMVALADRVKQGAYVKGTNGQLRSDDELARALDGVSVTDVIRIGLDLLKLEDNPYSALNVGQQSMNLRNRLRGAIKKDVVKIADIAEYITRNGIHVVTAEAVAKAKAEREAKQAAAKAEKEAKAEAARKAEAEKAPVTPTAETPAETPAPEQTEEAAA